MRIWVELNAAGLAVHPYYVVTDQLIRKQRGAVSLALAHEVDRLEQSVIDLLGGNALHMVLRVGYARQEVVRSRRLPIGDVCELE
ncbi:hypothetical protein [Aestuariirhabdus litorea]|nr:hypothetical protein [Aestuariirhabdus litorea]RWW97804.1 hypothetical protein DZC74_05595 [Endozoicomonadaceae bacterium GTF-13]